VEPARVPAGRWLHRLRDPLDGIAALAPVNLSTYYQPTGAAAFLQQHLSDPPFRYFGYAPDVDGQPVAYTVRFLDPSTANLEVNNHALPLGLYDIQGYDASHLRRYDSFLAALNGQTQNYHNAEVFPRGLSSPLLDLLNARYVIVPAHSDAVDAPALERFPNTVYQDGQVRILENPMLSHAPGSSTPTGSSLSRTRLWRTSPVGGWMLTRPHCLKILHPRWRLHQIPPSTRH